MGIEVRPLHTGSRAGAPARVRRGCGAGAKPRATLGRVAVRAMLARLGRGSATLASGCGCAPVVSVYAVLDSRAPSHPTRCLPLFESDMTADTPAIKLTGDATGKWKIELRNFPEIEKVLGREVLNAFCRCFVHSDRLTSTISCTYTSEHHHGHDSVAFGRDLTSMVWFTVGTLRELALAIRDARAALAKRGWLEPESEHWVTLCELEERWENQEFFRTMRNVAAFHVDPKVIDKGLNELVKYPVIDLAEGQGEKNVDSTLSLGALALFDGLEMSLDDYGAFIEIVSADHGVVAQAVQTAFAHAAEAAGVLLD